MIHNIIKININGYGKIGYGKIGYGKIGSKEKHLGQIRKY
jgi:hypothetical protein